MITPPKYPRTPHASFSRGRSSDDIGHPDMDLFVGKEVVVLDKMDGGCTCIFGGTTYARSTGQPSQHDSFDFIKARHAWKSRQWPQRRYVYGENLYAAHSIPYQNLPDFFMLFNVRDREVWREWDFVEEFAAQNDFQVVPMVGRFKFSSVGEMAEMVNEQMARPSPYGEREGFIFRLTSAFHNEHFGLSTAKYVRENHVRTDEHWTRNWKPNAMAG